MVVMVQEVDMGYTQVPPQGHQLLGIGREPVGFPDSCVRAQHIESHGLTVWRRTAARMALIYFQLSRTFTLKTPERKA
jgi:hypothetical protein